MIMMFTLPIRISKLPSSNLLVSIVFKYFGDVFTGSEMVITANHTSRTFFKRLNFVFEMKRIFLFNRYFYHILHFVLFTRRFVYLKLFWFISARNYTGPGAFLVLIFWRGPMGWQGKAQEHMAGRDRHGTTLFKGKLSKFL